MAEKSFPLENTLYTAEDAQLWFATRTSGVYAGEHLGVTADGTMQLALSEGIAWLHCAKYAGVVYGNTSEKALAVSMADGQYDRIDRVCIRVELLANSCYAYVKQGAASANPKPPSLQRDNVAYEISVAQVRVGVGETGISAGSITDERLDETVCGLMRDGVTGVDTSVIQAQFEAMISGLQDELQAIYSGVERVNLNEYTATLSAGGWAGSGPYTQAVAVPGLLPSDLPFVDVDMSGAQTADEMGNLTDAFSLIAKGTAGTDALTAYAVQKPDRDIPIKIKVVR